MKRRKPQATSLEFFARLRWLDGRPLLDTIEPYRRTLFTKALDTYQADGSPQYNFILCGRAKKNWKSTDLILAAFYKLLIPDDYRGNQCFLIANDLDQANDDLSLAKKLVYCNPDLQAELQILRRELRRKDGGGMLEILPAGDAVGAHGKSGCFLGFDEIHGYKDYDVLEALQLDPHRLDAITWICSYDTFFNRAGVPLYDYKRLAQSGSDPRMLASWYSSEWCTDPAFADLDDPEAKANPSMGSWPQGRAYLAQQKRRLPHYKYRRLHLNLPGAPDGAAFSADLILAATVPGRKRVPPLPFTRDHPAYCAFVDMSGGSSDDAVLGIAHKCKDINKVIVDLVMSQTGKPPFNPRAAVKKFAETLREYNIHRIVGDAYAGETFRRDFEEEHITYIVSEHSKSDLYDLFEPLLNAGEVEIPDIPKLQEQLMTLIVKPSGKIDHQPNDHDDYSNACAGAAVCLLDKRPIRIHPSVLEAVRRGRGAHGAQPYGQSVVSIGNHYAPTNWRGGN